MANPRVSSGDCEVFNYRQLKYDCVRNSFPSNYSISIPKSTTTISLSLLLRHGIFYPKHSGLPLATILVHPYGHFAHAQAGTVTAVVVEGVRVCATLADWRGMLSDIKERGKKSVMAHARRLSQDRPPSTSSPSTTRRRTLQRAARRLASDTSACAL